MIAKITVKHFKNRLSINKTAYLDTELLLMLYDLFPILANALNKMHEKIANPIPTPRTCFLLSIFDPSSSCMNGSRDVKTVERISSLLSCDMIQGVNNYALKRFLY